MASSLLSIAASGARAARTALDVTAQNIANASTDGYVRRTLRTEEVTAAAGRLQANDISLLGVRVGGIDRNADPFRQAEVRRTNADAARSGTELRALENIEAAIEQTRGYELLVEFEASLRQLTTDPTDPSLRSAALAAADGFADTMNVTQSGLDTVGEGLRFQASAGVDRVNLLTNELARVNTRVARASPSSADRATLLDQRDSLLEQLSSEIDISASFAIDGSAEVRFGNSTGPIMVQGSNTATLALTSAADGTISFTLDGAAITPKAGNLAGQALGLDAVAAAQVELDALAAGIITTGNAAQAAGAALDGSAGQPLFSGTDARTIAAAFDDGALLATAPAGSPAGSADAANLNNFIAAFEGAGHVQQSSDLLFSISTDVAGRRITSEALDAIAATARISLEQQSGVDLDQEAVNLLRYQQAFQASGRAMQTASDIIDTLLGIGR